MQIDMQRFHAAFFDESAEHLAAMEESLLGLERSPDDAELLNRIFRAAHSIKGASGTFDRFRTLRRACHGIRHARRSDRPGGRRGSGPPAGHRCPDPHALASHDRLARRRGHSFVSPAGAMDSLSALVLLQ